MIKKILKYPEDKEILTQKSNEVTEITEEIKQNIQDLIDTVKDSKGVGISAIQIGIPLKICVINWNGIHVFINPIVTRTRGEYTLEEGCLSVENIYVSTTRAQKIWVTALNEKGEEFEYAQGGVGSYILQHELEHFEGSCTLFREYDRLEEEKKNV